MVWVQEATANETEACSQNCRGKATKIAEARPKRPPSKAICARPPAGNSAAISEVMLKPSMRDGAISSKLSVKAS